MPIIVDGPISALPANSRELELHIYLGILGDRFDFALSHPDHPRAPACAENEAKIIESKYSEQYSQYPTEISVWNSHQRSSLSVFTGDQIIIAPNPRFYQLIYFIYAGIVVSPVCCYHSTFGVVCEVAHV